jgi:hypothetical protein
MKQFELTNDERLLVRNALLERANDLRRCSSGLKEQERDELLALSKKYLALQAKFR